MMLTNGDPQRDALEEVGSMKSMEYVRKEERIIESLLEMLERSVNRLETSKDVPPYMLKEIIELLQIYIDVSHTRREELILSLLADGQADALKEECEDIHATLKKHERFLLKVVEAYDLGYQGARGVFPHYARQYVYILRQHLKLENELLQSLITDYGQRDGLLLRELKKIDGGVQKKRERGLIRMETLKREMRMVAA
jgi:hemerythrin-like domain-containing protein